METLLGILMIILIIVLAIEIFSYRDYKKAATQLLALGDAMEIAFHTVSSELIHTNNLVEATEVKGEANTKGLIVTQRNMELVAVYLELFRDAMAIDPERFKRIGNIETLDTTT